MKLTNKDMVEHCMERIELIQQHVRNVDNAKTFLSLMNIFDDIYVGDLRHALIKQEVDEWRKLAMWGLTLDDAERDRIKAAVHDRFLRDDVKVADWFSGGVSPSQWLSSDENAFRAMAKAAFAPKAGS